MVICLGRGANLHMVQLMPLPLTVSCFSKIQIGFSFLVPAHLGSPGKRGVKRVMMNKLRIGRGCGLAGGNQAVPPRAVEISGRRSTKERRRTTSFKSPRPRRRCVCADRSSTSVRPSALIPAPTEPPPPRRRRPAPRPSAVHVVVDRIVCRPAGRPVWLYSRPFGRAAALRDGYSTYRRQTGSNRDSPFASPATGTGSRAPFDFQQFSLSLLYHSIPFYLSQTTKVHIHTHRHTNT